MPFDTLKTNGRSSFGYCLCAVAGMSWVIVTRNTSPVFEYRRHHHWRVTSGWQLQHIAARDTFDEDLERRRLTIGSKPRRCAAQTQCEAHAQQ
jgi:hypothetical protein